LENRRDYGPLRLTSSPVAQAGAGYHSVHSDCGAVFAPIRRGRRGPELRPKEGTISNPQNPVDLERYLGGVDYPANRDALVSAVRDNGADDSLVKKLEQLPNQEYSGPDKVTAAFFQKS
jgi:uncharacterized protein DUF2795